ncbi:MAG TPA: discoidin domain-containing protein [Spirochaetota bacterium]|nr:discoidin domain-containing protein [Spirochaetota bacterium]
MKKIFAFLFMVLFITMLYADSVDFMHILLEETKCSASSSLAEKNKPSDYYGAEKAFDKNSETAWCEGKKDSGVGEYIILETKPVKIHGVAILNGFGKFRHLYYQNNRVKKFRLTLYPESGQNKIITAEFGKDLCGRSLAGGKLTINEFCEDNVPDYEKDKAAYNKCIKEKTNECIFDEYDGGGQKILLKKPMVVKKLKLEILSTYSGTKYNDTCIAEFGLLEFNIDAGEYNTYRVTKY